MINDNVSDDLFWFFNFNLIGDWGIQEVKWENKINQSR